MPAPAYLSNPAAAQIALALKETDLTTLDLWDALDSLSSHTEIEAVEVPVEGVVLEPGDHFSAVMNIYVMLNYDKDDAEGFSTSDSFAATVKGHLVNGAPVIDYSRVDTSAFYE